MSAIRRAGAARDRDRGQALVEFALIFPVLMLLLVAIFDVGRLVFAYNDITNAARVGARVAIVNQGGTAAETAAMSQAALGLADDDVEVAYLAPDLSGGCDAPFHVGCIAEVRVSYEWSPITPIIGSILGPITVTTETRMPIERVYP